MEFDDSVSPPSPPIMQPYNSGLTQPASQPTALFGGGVPAVEFAPVSAIHAAAIAALHGPMFQPVYEAGLARPVFHSGTVHAAVGTHLDRRG